MTKSKPNFVYTLILVLFVACQISIATANDSNPLDEYPGFSWDDHLNFTTEQVRRLQTDLLHDLIDECMSKKGFDYRRKLAIYKIELLPLDNAPEQLSLFQSESTLYHKNLEKNTIESNRNNSKDYNMALYGTKSLPRGPGIDAALKNQPNCFDDSFDSIQHVYSVRARLIDETLTMNKKKNKNEKVIQAANEYSKCMSENQIEIESPNDIQILLLAAARHNETNRSAALSRYHRICEKSSEYHSTVSTVVTEHRKQFIEKHRQLLETSIDDLQRAIEQLIEFKVIEDKSELENRFKLFHSAILPFKWNKNIETAAKIQCPNKYEVVSEHREQISEYSGWSEILCL